MDFRKSVANGKKLLADKKGTSIVSVMVAFSILMLGILMMTTSTTVSLKLINESGAKRKVIESAVEEYYLKGEKGILVSQNFTLVLVNGTDIQLKINNSRGYAKHIQKIISAMSTIILIRTDENVDLEKTAE